ncbi:MAG: hypothetical protein ACC658_14190, partial [Acidimicrobiia bacterium]
WCGSLGWLRVGVGEDRATRVSHNSYSYNAPYAPDVPHNVHCRTEKEGSCEKKPTANSQKRKKHTENSVSDQPGVVQFTVDRQKRRLTDHSIFR